jgi:GH15 family glucan-1,4-alpha-glucosidase
MRRLVCERGVWTARAGDLYLRWSGAATAVAARHSGGPRLELRLDLEPGVAHDLVLEVSDRPLNQDPPDSQVLWRGTEHAWSQQVPRLDASLVAADARQAYAVLRGLTGSLGGMVAAATTSLPERSESGRNYDYRYAWIRDQSYAGQAVALAGPHPLLDDAVRFVAGRLLCDGPDTKPAYTCTGERVPDERRLGLAGYPGGGDRIGNWANSQFQLDQFGEALLLFAAAARHDRLDADGWHAAEVAAAAIEKRWQEPDAGIWELDNRLWTHSRLVCVAGLKQMGDAIAAADPATAARWASHAETIMAATSASSVHPTGRWQRAPDDPALDAALLMGSIRGGVPADDPRTRATLRAFTEELTEDLFAYRFRHQPGPLGDGEGAFLLCGFMVALAQLDQGERGLALRWFERNRSGCSTSGLFSEEYDVAQRQLRGNLPQAFVHALFLECSIRLAQT